MRLACGATATDGDVVIYPASGTGAWEAALVNTLSPGDRVLMAETGHFAALWNKLASRLGLAVEFLPGDWRHGAPPDAIEAKLAADRQHAIKAVCMAVLGVHISCLWAAALFLVHRLRLTGCI